MRALLLALCLLPASGCTLDPGRGFARLSAGLWSTFRGLDPALGRTLAGGAIKTPSSFALQLSQLELTVRELRLVRATDSSTASAAALARLPVLQAHSLLGTGTRQELASCLPSCELEEGPVGEVQILLDRLRLRGVLRDVSSTDRLGGKQPTVMVDWDLGGAALSQKQLVPEGSIAVDRDHPYFLTLSVSLPVSEKLLDGVAWDGLAGAVDGAITIDSKQNAAAGEALRQGLTATTLGVQTTRSED